MLALRHVASKPMSAADADSVVFIVDDDLSVREALEALIEQAGWRAYTFASAQAFLAHPGIAAPSCLLLDVFLPDLSGLALQERIGHRPDMPIIFMTGQGDVPTTVRAMKAGAAEFLTKPFSDDAVLGAIDDALRVSRQITTVKAELEILRSRYDELTQRERDVMALVVSGLLNKQVGGKLGISEITVKAHRGRVMRKMQASSFADLVNMAARLGTPL